ncbi:hypothetical protein [Solimonas sp. SE-A11]|uniref:hypothetical protein n=1 Tax=Solimonas sp. SE-A11 TaxID=3054954 RepID=UPI00259C8D39|nr:hypothetical protein [Solimonas sp. SE-A11]MDM4770441.1 hypothetical protein [Solimonas sp. SE-A11]
MRPVQLLAVSALLLSANAYAASFDSLDLYYSSADIELQGRSGGVDYSGDLDSLDGFGVKFRGSIAEDFFFSGEYQGSEVQRSGLTLRDNTGAAIATNDGVELDYTEWRLGVGLPFYRERSLTLFGLLEYVNTELKGSYDTTDGNGAVVSNRLRAKQDGVAAHGGVLFNPTAAWSVYGQVGYLKLDDVDGIEYLAGTALQVHRYGGLFAEYRSSDLEGGGGEVKLMPWRFGVYLLVQ